MELLDWFDDQQVNDYQHWRSLRSKKPNWTLADVVTCAKGIASEIPAMGIELIMSGRFRGGPLVLMHNHEGSPEPTRNRKPENDSKKPDGVDNKASMELARVKREHVVKNSLWVKAGAKYGKPEKTHSPYFYADVFWVLHHMMGDWA